MSRPSLFGSPLFLGFDHLEQMLDRVQKSSDGYPPYNIEQTGDTRLRITLAVAGFSMDDLQITQEDNQLVIRGRQQEENEQGRHRPAQDFGDHEASQDGAVRRIDAIPIRCASLTIAASPATKKSRHDQCAVNVPQPSHG